MDYAFYSPQLDKVRIFHQGLTWNLQSISGNGLISARKKKDKARQTVFLTPTNLFRDDLEEEEFHDDFTASVESILCHEMEDDHAVQWVRSSQAQDWNTKSLAIMMYATMLGGCTDRVVCSKRRTSTF